MTAVLEDTVRSIPLTNGLFAFVDACDYERLSGHKWFAKRCNGRWYAMRNEKGKSILMHVEILGKKDGFMTDHRNGNGLDNRRENLRHSTRSQNMQNQYRRKDKASSKYKGVSYKKRIKKWVAQIRVNGKSLWLGCFSTEIEAAQAYDLAATEHFGTFARINEYFREELESGQI